MHLVSLVRRFIRHLLISTSIVMAIAPTTHAQNYGQGAYGLGLYSQGLVQIGPVTLPVTGPQLEGIISAISIGLAVGLAVWARDRHRRTTV